MADKKNLMMIEKNLKEALQQLDELKNEQYESDLAFITERLNQFEETINEIKRAII